MLNSPMRRSQSKPFLTVIACCAVLALLWSSPASAAESNRDLPLVLSVQPGQTLGMISKRWNVPLDVLCSVNAIQRKKPIVPGQQLLVPALNDKHGSAAKDLRKRGFLDPKRRPALLRELQPKPAPQAARRAPKTQPRSTAKQRTAKHQGSGKAKAAKSDDPGKNAEARAGAKGSQGRAEEHGREDSAKHKRSAKARSPSERRAKVAQRSATKQVAAKRRGYVKLSSLMGRWEGFALDRKGNPTPEAEAGFRKVLRSWRTGASAQIDARLIRMVAQVSDHFSGKQILVVSGYRPKRKLQFTAHSRHNAGEAMDFRVEGVDNTELRDYARKFSRAGVGFYPNSSFIHLDARELSTYWIDYSGPGEKPRYAHQGYRDRASSGSTATQSAKPADAESDKASAPTEPPASQPAAPAKAANTEEVARTEG